MIEVKNLNLKIKDKVLLEDINATFKDGQIHGLVGRNGSGKTVLMKCICGFMRTTSGEISVDGKIIGKDIDFPKNVGVIIENPNFINYLSGYRNLKMLSEYKNILKKQQILDVIEKVGLSEAKKLAVGKYSLGMRQRLAIAQAIMEDPDILILDEPFNGLDEEGVDEIRGLLLELKKAGKNIILSSHNREDINILCDDIWRINKGRIIEKIESNDL